MLVPRPASSHLFLTLLLHGQQPLPRLPSVSTWPSVLKPTPSRLQPSPSICIHFPSFINKTFSALSFPSHSPAVCTSINSIQLHRTSNLPSSVTINTSSTSTTSKQLQSSKVSPLVALYYIPSPATRTFKHTNIEQSNVRTLSLPELSNPARLPGLSYTALGSRSSPTSPLHHDCNSSNQLVLQFVESRHSHDIFLFELLAPIPITPPIITW